MSTNNTRSFSLWLIILVLGLTAIALLPAATSEVIDTAYATGSATQYVSPTYVPTTYTWVARDNVPTLLCIALDNMPTPGGVHDTMRPCDNGVDVPLRKYSDSDSNTIVVPDKDDDPIVPVIIVVPDTPDKVHTNHGNHYGNNKQGDNNPVDVHNKHNGCNANCTGNGKEKSNNGKGKDK